MTNHRWMTRGSMVEPVQQDEAAVFAAVSLSPNLPEAARRYLTHAIHAGTVLARRVEIAFHGQVRLKPGGRWLTFRAKEQINVTRAFKVTSTAHVGPIPIRLFEQYIPDRAVSQLLMFGRLPIRTQQGANFTRAAHSRVMVESSWLPSAYLPVNGCTWFEKDGNLRVTTRVAGDQVELMLSLVPDGGLQAITCQRWSNLGEDGNYAWIPFTSITEAEATFDGYTIPAKIRASWWAGTEKAFDFFRAEVDEAHFTL